MTSVYPARLAEEVMVKYSRYDWSVRLGSVWVIVFVFDSDKLFLTSISLWSKQSLTRSLVLMPPSFRFLPLFFFWFGTGFEMTGSTARWERNRDKAAVHKWQESNQYSLQRNGHNLFGPTRELGAIPGFLLRQRQPPCVRIRREWKPWLHPIRYACCHYVPILYCFLFGKSFQTQCFSNRCFCQPASQCFNRISSLTVNIVFRIWQLILCYARNGRKIRRRRKDWTGRKGWE